MWEDRYHEGRYLGEDILRRVGIMKGVSTRRVSRGRVSILGEVSCLFRNVSRVACVCERGGGGGSSSAGGKESCGVKESCGGFATCRFER